ncbi:MAG: helix-turn-helix domain-containing protein [Thermoleophilia bacterium]|nr:helix-turn-helix domain-containing protein [Thermoleophilia bacterium]
MSTTQTIEMLSVTEAGRRLGVKRARAYQLAKAGDLPVVEVAGCFRVPVAALDAYIAALAEQAIDNLGGGDG